MAFLIASAFVADLPRATFGEVVQRRARQASIPNEHEWSMIIAKLMFALQLAVAATSRKRRNPCTVCLDPIRLILEGMFLQYERPIFLRPLEVHPENRG